MAAKRKIKTKKKEERVRSKKQSVFKKRTSKSKDRPKQGKKKRVIFKTNASRRDWGSVECSVNEDLNDPGKEVSVRARDT